MNLNEFMGMTGYGSKEETKNSTVILEYLYYASKDVPEKPKVKLDINKYLSDAIRKRSAQQNLYVAYNYLKFKSIIQRYTDLELLRLANYTTYGHTNVTQNNLDILKENIIFNHRNPKRFYIVTLIGDYDFDTNLCKINLDEDFEILHSSSDVMTYVTRRFDNSIFRMLNNRKKLIIVVREFEESTNIYKGEYCYVNTVFVE